MKFTYLKNIIETSELFASNLNHSTTGDGRLDSAESEIVIINHLKNLFKNTEVKVIEPPQERYWYDILIEYKGQKFPINIKITSGISADNISSKIGVFYALTGLWPEKVSGLSRWSSYNQLLTENLNYETNADYYFIVYFKTEQTFLFTSLKQINTLVANGNNLPFQCNWSNNLSITQRSNQEQIDYIMDIYFDSWIKKVNGLEPLIRWKEGKQ